jgi:hypothetical protein
MNVKKILGFSFALLATSSAANAVTRIPTLISDIPGASAPSLTLDWNFLASSQTLSVTKNSDNNYTLTSSSTGLFSFFNNTGSYNGTASVYTLSATFDKSGNFIQNSLGSDYLNITGYFGAATAAHLSSNGNLTVAAPTSSSVLFNANLTDFGYSTTQNTLGFVTSFLASWSNQGVLTGGSVGESAYLFSSTNSLAPVTNAFAIHDLSTLVGNSYTGVSSITSVPVPFSGLLFGTGLLSLLGLNRRKSA